MNIAIVPVDRPSMLSTWIGTAKWLDAILLRLQCIREIDKIAICSPKCLDSSAISGSIDLEQIKFLSMPKGDLQRPLVRVCWEAAKSFAPGCILIGVDPMYPFLSQASVEKALYAVDIEDFDSAVSTYGKHGIQLWANMHHMVVQQPVLCDALVAVRYKTTTNLTEMTEYDKVDLGTRIYSVELTATEAICAATDEGMHLAMLEGHNRGG